MRNYFGGSQPQMPGGGPFGKMGQWMGMFKQFAQNPIDAMLGGGINLPSNIQSNNYEGIVNYLRSSGTMTDEQFQQCSQFANMAQMFLGGKKF